MEDKVFLDEAGLGEVGKVISKFYASKEDIKDLESLKDFVDKNNSMSFCFVTQEEWQSLDDDSRRFFITKTNDPYLIVALESKPNSKEKFGIFDDDPVWIFNDIELNKGEEKHGQPYLIVNLPTSAELNFNWFDKNGATGATYQYKIQLALGLRDYVAYYQIVEAIDGEIKYTNWSCLNDMYSRQWIDKLKAELGKMETEINHIDSKVADRVHKSYIVNNLIAGGTNKVLSAEQGKILNETKADKKDTDVLFQNLQTIQFRSDQQNQEILNINPDFTVLSGSYVVKPSRIIHEPTDIFLSSYPFASYPSNIGVLTICRENQTLYDQSSLVKIVQRIYDLNTRVVYIRKTIEYKNEYNNDWICQHYSFDDDLINFCQQIQWEEWSVIKYDSHPFPFASPNEAGFMSPEDKSKLDSIDMDIINNSIKAQDIIDNLESDDPTKPLSAKQGSQLNTQIKNLTQEIESLKTQLNELKTTPKE